jgi:hypothetical protein
MPAEGASTAPARRSLSGGAAGPQASAPRRLASVLALLRGERQVGPPLRDLHDVLTRVDTRPASDIDAIPPHRWTPPVRIITAVDAAA